MTNHEELIARFEAACRSEEFGLVVNAGDDLAAALGESEGKLDLVAVLALGMMTDPSTHAVGRRILDVTLKGQETR